MLLKIILAIAIAIIGFWLLGALITAIITWIYVFLSQYYFKNHPRYIKASLPEFLPTFVIANLLWPVVIRDRFEEAWFYMSVFRGKLPRWIVYGENECPGRGWYLKDGGKFSAGSTIGKTGEKTSVGGSYDETDEELEKRPTLNQPGNVWYRYRMIAPEVRSISEWIEMKIEYHKSYGMDSDDDLEDEDFELSKTAEEFCEIPEFSETMILERGKYQFLFRVKNLKGDVEELSGLTVVVTAPGEYEPRG